ncbi:hypothetical protein ACIPY6_02885 [Streptomyces sp. NPDC090054]|uniref:hypothetical protein n=1 Tax=Streptomyces sp. NPDC090054 TaxID=3365933 RepID=UPI00381EB780
MTRIYATAEQYEAYTGITPPLDIEARLVRASRFLDSTLFRLCAYTADAGTGLPTDTVVAEAFAAAVCAQVQWWEETADELGTAGQWGTVKIGSVSLGPPGSSSGSGAGGGRSVAAAALEALQQPDLTPDRLRVGAVVW